jgi:sugar diacid utilization regulator
MEINSFVLFYLLEKQFNLRCVNECLGVTVRQPVLLDTNRLSQGYVYISDDPEKVRNIRHGAACVLLLAGPLERYELPPFVQECDIACIENPLSALQALQSVYALLLDLLGWDMRLSNASHEGAEYDRMFKIIREMHDMPLILHDRNFFNIAYTGDFYDFVRNDGDSREQIPLELVNDFIMDKDGAYNLFELRTPFMYPPGPNEKQWLCCNIFNDNYFQGRLVAIYDRKSANVNGQLDLLAHYCGYISRVFIHHSKTLIEKKQRDSLHELIRSFVVDSKDFMERELASVLKDADWQTGDTYFLVLFHIPDKGEYESWSAYMCRQAESAIPKSAAIMADPFIVWVINDRFQRNARNKCGDFAKLIPDLTQKLCCAVGISNKLNAFGDLRKGYKQAGAALRLGRERRSSSGCYSFSDYVMEYIMDRAAEELSADSLLHPGIAALLKYDRENNTEYLKTIRYFTEARYNMTIAAAKIPVHRLTFLRRLEKIREISHINFEDPDELLHAHLSLKLLDWV